MQLNPYLSFNGQCDAAFKFYEECLGGKILSKITYGELPRASHWMASHWPEDSLSKIVYISLKVGDRILMGSDTPPAHYEAPKGFHVLINSDDAAEAERVFSALSEGGQVTMRMQEPFWEAVFVDQFGIPWMINYEKEA